MAEVTVKSRRLTRDKLASFLKAQELIKAFEDLQDDIISAIPAAVDGNAAAIDELLINADAMSATAATALAIAAIAEARAAQAEAEVLSGQLASVRDQVAVLERSIEDLKQGAQL